LLAGFVLPALLLPTLTGFLATLLTALVLLAALLLLVLIILVWVIHRLFLLVDFSLLRSQVAEAFVPECHLTRSVGRQQTSIKFDNATASEPN
jgi:hypothetical protein